LSGVREEFGSILRSERCRFGAEGNFRGGIELRRWRGAGSDPHSELEKKFLLSGWRTGAEHSHRLSGRVVKLMGRVRWDVNRFARVHDLLCASEDGLQFALEYGERFFKVMAVRRRPTTRRDVHVDQAETSSGVCTREKDGVGVAYDSDMREFGFGLGDDELPGRVVERDSDTVVPGRIGLAGHSANSFSVS
jgi:hypothetical protein